MNLFQIKFLVVTDGSLPLQETCCLNKEKKSECAILIHREIFSVFYSDISIFEDHVFFLF